MDHAQTGTITASIKDPHEVLNPDNSGSPLNTGGNTITSYRAGQVYAVWPNQPGSGNLINTNVNPNYDPSFDSSLGGWTAVGAGTTLSQTGAQHFNGLSSLLVNQTTAGVNFGITQRFGLAPGIKYAFGCQIYATGGTHVVAQVTDAAGVIHQSATVVTQNAWVLTGFTWTAVDTAEQIIIYGTTAGSPSFYVDATQLEFGSSPTTFTTSGPTAYNLITHYVERYPTTYDMGGLRSVRPLQGVDALGILNNTVINQSYDLTIAADNPTYYFPLSNAVQPSTGAALSNAGQAIDVSGNTTIAPVIGKLTNGVPTYLISGAINWGADTQPDGTPAVQFLANVANQETTMDVIGGSFSADTLNGMTVEVWAKATSGSSLFGGLFVLFPQGNVTYPASTVQFVEGVNFGSLNWAYDPTSSALQSIPTGFYPGIPAGALNPPWHYYAMAVRGGVWYHMIDGVETSQSVAAVGNIGFTYLCHCEATCAQNPQSQVSVARWAVYPSDIGLSRRQAHYNRGAGYLGELAGARVNRLLTQYWGGPISTAPGVMALAEDFLYNGQTLLNVLQGIESSERGLTYANRNGEVVFEDRTSRYSGTQASLWTFGENPPSTGPGITEDASTPAVVTGTGTGNITTASFSPPTNSLLVAIVAGGFNSGGSTSATVSDTAGHTWTSGVSANTFGLAQISYTYLTSAPGSITVTASYTHLGGGRLLAVRVLNGARASQSGAASATSLTSGSTSAAVTITTTTSGSQVYGVSYDASTNSVFTANGSTTIVNNFNDVTDTVTLAAWKATVVTGSPGSTVLGGTYSASAGGDNVAFEVLPAGTITGTEYPYSDYQSDFDPTYVFTQANLTRPDNLAFAPIPNPPSVNPTYGQRIVQQEVQCTNDYDLTQAANSYLSRYAKPRTRISKLVLDPAGNPSLFPVVLSLEISQRITVKRRAGGAVISGDFYIEKISHSVDFASGKWLVTLQLSPVIVPTAWVLGSSTFGVLGTNTVPVY